MLQFIMPINKKIFFFFSFLDKFFFFLVKYINFEFWFLRSGEHPGSNSLNAERASLNIDILTNEPQMHPISDGVGYTI